METIHHLDYFLFDFINNQLSNSFFDILMPIVRNKKTWIPLYFILAFFLVYKFNMKAIVVSLFAVVSIGLADGISSHVLKPLVARIRPCNLSELTENIILRIDCSGGFSFPSSHAANHFALAIFIGLALYKVSPWFLRVGIFWAASISFAQVYVGVHFPIDILAGALLGILIGFFLNFIINKIKFLDIYSKKWQTKR